MDIGPRNICAKHQSWRAFGFLRKVPDLPKKFWPISRERRSDLHALHARFVYWSSFIYIKNENSVFTPLSGLKRPLPHGMLNDPFSMECWMTPSPWNVERPLPNGMLNDPFPMGCWTTPSPWGVERPLPHEMLNDPFPMGCWTTLSPWDVERPLPHEMLNDPFPMGCWTAPSPWGAERLLPHEMLNDP